MSDLELGGVKAELNGLISEFFHAVSFERGGKPSYGRIPALFIERGLLIKSVSSTPEISSVQEFIEPREALVQAGMLTRFHESELSEATVIFGNVAHRFSAYAKSGISSGTSFEARGVITTQFIKTLGGWRISAMAWDDERPGLSIVGFDPTQRLSKPPAV
jgi:hypothetical protein